MKRVGAVIGSLRFPSARPSPGSVTGLACEIRHLMFILWLQILSFYILSFYRSIVLSFPNLYYYKRSSLSLVIFFLHAFLGVYEGGQKHYFVQDSFLCITFDFTLVPT